MDKHLYAIIISYNKIEPVVKAINSVFDSYNRAKIILIDNSEEPYILQELKERLKNFSNIIFVKNKTNVGFSKAVNQGIKIALDNGADYILLLNDDAYLDDYCIEHLIKALETDEKSMLAGPTIFYHNAKNKIWHTGGYFNKFLGSIWIPYKNKDVDIDTFKTFSIKEVDFLTGCVLMIKKEAIEKVGFFDEDLFFYGEDLDYSLQVKKKGFKLLWVPYAFAWHDIDIEKGRTSPFVMYNLARSNIILRRKNFDEMYFYYYLVLHFLLYTPYRLYQIWKGSRNFKSLIAWLKGTWDGLHSKK